MPVRACGAEITKMTSIGIAGLRTMESWMVDLLFAQPGQAKVDTPTAASMAVSAVSVASAAKSAVAPATGQAIAALQAGGANAASNAGSAAPNSMTVAQSNALVASNNAMTSSQISAAFYSGGGLQETGTGVTETFANVVQAERNTAQIALNLANDPAAAAAAGQDPDSLRAMAAHTNAYADSMQKAFDSHTLVIQKLSDVSGLNFTERETFGGSSEDSQPARMTWTGSYDKQEMSHFISQFKDKKQVGMPFLGGVQLLLTWTDEKSI